MINPDTILLDLIYQYPQTEKLFRKYEEQTNICIMCNHLFATLDEVSQIINCDADELINKLKEVIDREAKQGEGGI